MSKSNTTYQITQEHLNMIRKNTPEMIAHDIVTTQAMGPEVGEAFMALYNNSKTEKQLRAEGYKPVCETTKLMWIKEE